MQVYEDGPSFSEKKVDPQNLPPELFVDLKIMNNKSSKRQFPIMLIIFVGIMLTVIVFMIARIVMGLRGS